MSLSYDTWKTTDPRDTDPDNYAQDEQLADPPPPPPDPIREMRLNLDGCRRNLEAAARDLDEAIKYLGGLP